MEANRSSKRQVDDQLPERRRSDKYLLFKAVADDRRHHDNASDLGKKTIIPKKYQNAGTRNDIEISEKTYRQRILSEGRKNI